jgi:hypothetical protein
VKIIALFRMRDDKGVDDKVVCVPEHDPNWRHVERLEDLSETLRDEISHFFSIYKQPEGIAVKVDGWFPRDQALEIIDEAKARFEDGKKAADGEADEAEASSEPDDGAEASSEPDASGADTSGDSDGDGDPTDDAADAKS